MQAVGVLPIAFHNNDNGNHLASVSHSGTITIATTSPLPQSSIVNRDWTSYHSNTSSLLSMSPVHSRYPS